MVTGKQFIHSRVARRDGIMLSTEQGAYDLSTKEQSMTKRRFEQIASDYWAVSYALRDPLSPAISCQEALGLTRSADRLRPEEHQLRELMHIILYDIIEGNTGWREKRRVVGSVLTLHTKD